MSKPRDTASAYCAGYPGWRFREADYCWDFCDTPASRQEPDVLWRAEAYARSARWTCTRATLDSYPHTLLRFDEPRWPLTNPHGDGPRCSLRVSALHEAQQLAYTGTCVSERGSGA